MENTNLKGVKIGDYILLHYETGDLKDTKNLIKVNRITSTLVIANEDGYTYNLLRFRRLTGKAFGNSSQVSASVPMPEYLAEVEQSYVWMRDLKAGDTVALDYLHSVKTDFVNVITVRDGLVKIVYGGFYYTYDVKTGFCPEQMSTKIRPLTDKEVAKGEESRKKSDAFERLDDVLRSNRGKFSSDVIEKIADFIESIHLTTI